MKKTVALIYGGEGCERDISIASAKNLSNLIDREKFDVIEVLITKEGEWLTSDGHTPTFPLFLNGVSGLYRQEGILSLDAAIPCLHGDYGEDGIITGALTAAHIPFVGANTLAGAVCSDKIITKAVAEFIGIPTARWIYSTGREITENLRLRAEEKLGYPMIIKPSGTGSSIGITRVSSPEEFSSAYRTALLHGDRVLIEEALDIKAELECAYLGLGVNAHFAIGSVYNGGALYGYEEKYGADSSASVIPECVLDKKTEEKIISMSKRLRAALSVYGMGRFDFFLTEDGELIFNEINVFPGMTSKSLYPSLTNKMGLADGEFINLLLSEAIYDRRF